DDRTPPLSRLAFPGVGRGRGRGRGGAGGGGGGGLEGAPPIGAPAAEAVMARAGAENFPVASRLLPRGARRHLLAVYGFARLVDEVGDCAPGDRLAALDWLEEDLDRAREGRAEHPLLARLQPTLRDCALPRLAAPARAVRAADRGQPRRPARQPL